MTRTPPLSVLALTVALAAGAAAPALADDAAQVQITLKDHKFSPTEVRVKADTPTTVTLINNDEQSEEFDSTSLKIEKVVAGHSTGIMRWRPLAPGRYKFMGEFHSETAQGVVIAE